MPWVFLHAIKDYYELPWLQSLYPSIKATYNLVPSLLVQLLEYKSESVNDKFLNVLKKDVSKLGEDEKGYLLNNLFHSNPHTMIKPFARYHQIFLKRNRLSLKEQIVRFDDGELVDLEVLFILCWCGNYLRENNQTVKNLINKGSNFTQNEKLELLNSLHAFIGEIVPFYKKLQDEHKIEISTTPFYHPILPLLVDMNNGVLANKHAAVADFGRALREDASKHIEMAISYFEKLFGFKPKGFWPSEGSVSGESLEILADHGIKWAATDEEILFKTKKSNDRALVYKKYKLHHYGREIGLVFRDKALSDAIGFKYAFKSPKDAVDDFMNTLKAIYDHRDTSCIVPVILDGENAWESYLNNAKEFFCELYSRIERTDWCECARIGDVFDDSSVATDSLLDIEPGSWIGGDFHIWIGEPEENDAWRLLKETRDTLYEHKKGVSKELFAKAEKELFIAEGSDWFWWYGDDHYTPLKDEFDLIFRTHLINIYDLLGLDFPQKLNKPIPRVYQAKISKKAPANKLSIQVDGRQSSFFEWSGAGYVSLSQKFGAMSTSGNKIYGVYYGFCEEYLYLMLDANLEELKHHNYSLEINFTTPVEHSFLVSLKDGNHKKAGIELALHELCEIKIKKSLIMDELCDSVDFSVTIKKGLQLIESAPLNGTAELEVPKNYLTSWFI